MAQNLNLSILGLITDPNQLSEVPGGAQAVADNIVINRKSVAESRRGQKQYGSTLGTILKLFSYRDTLLASHGGDSMSYDSDDAGTWSPFTGTFSAPTGANRIRSMEANRNFYITSDEGIKKLDAIPGEFIAAGVPPALGVKGFSGVILTEINPKGFLGASQEVGYRMVWGYTDANDNEIVGAPSSLERASNIIENMSAQVVSSYFIPDGITTSYFYRIYRSANFDDPLSIPSDELQLVLEGYPTATDISNGYFEFTDNLPESERGASLYTSPSQETILQSNYPPPYARDMAIYKNYSIYANTIQFQSMNVKFKKVGSGGIGVYSGSANTHNGSTTLDGLSVAATKVVQDLTYTADAAGYDGNFISISYIQFSGTFPLGTIIVSGNTIVIYINSGVTTATQIKTALDADPDASALVNISVSGGGGTGQVITSYPTTPTATPTYLAGGFDTSCLSEGMLVTGVGIPATTYISEVVSADSVLLGKPATATATVTVSFADIITVAGIKYTATTSFPGTREFQVPSLTHIDTTTLASYISLASRSLVYSINNDSSQTVYAYFTGTIVGTNGETGTFQLRVKNISDDAFSVYSTKPQSFDPVIPNLNYGFNISVANPTVLSTSADHNLTTGDEIIITDSSSTPTVNGTRTVTVTSNFTFTVPVHVTVQGRYFEWVKSDSQNLSTNNPQKNMLYISKFQQPEAVPIVNFIPVGSANYNIIRVVTLNEYVYIFKEEEGLYRLTGDGFENFRIDLFNASTILQVPESIAVVDNKIYCYSEQSIVAISGGEELVSAPIRSDLLALNSGEYTNFGDVSFGINYDVDNKYIFYTVSETDDTTCTQAYVYNYFTNTWTRWTLSRSCGIVKPANNRMYSGCISPAFVYEERKQLNRLDFADEEYSVAIVSSSGDEVVLADASNVVVGMTLKQDDLEALVISIDTNTLTIDEEDQAWQVAAAKVYTPIATSVQWVPDSSQNSGILKQFRECTLFFRRGQFRDVDLYVQSNFSTSFTPTTITSPAYSTWGLLPWGNFPWGGGVNQNEIEIRTYIPLEKQRASWINFRVDNAEAFTNIYLQGISVVYEPMSERFR